MGRSIEQTINTNIGSQYTVYYCLSGNDYSRSDNIYPIKEGRISVRAAGDSINNIISSEDFSFDISTVPAPTFPFKDIDKQWIDKSLTFTATSIRTTLRFQGLAPVDNCFGAVIDNVSVIESNCFYQNNCHPSSPPPPPPPPPDPCANTNCFISWTGASVGTPIFYQTIGDLVQDAEYYYRDTILGDKSYKINLIQQNLKFGRNIVT